MNRKIEENVQKIIYRLRRSNAKVEKKDVKNILLIRLDVLGDMIITIPVIREIRRAYPKANITFVCNKAMYNLIEPLPYIDEIIPYEKIKLGKHNFERLIVSAYKFARKNLCTKEYQLALVPTYPAQLDERLMISFARARQRVFYYKDEETRQSWIPELAVPVEQGFCSMMERHFYLLRALGMEIENDDLEIKTTIKDKTCVDKLFEHEGLAAADDRLKAVFSLATSCIHRDWPVERYAEVARWLQSEYGAVIILLGGKSDPPEYRNFFVQNVADVYDFAGKTTIRQSAEIMSRANLYIGGDTGTMHMAAVYKLQGVVITKDFGGGTAGELQIELFSPWKSPLHIIKPDEPIVPCGSECLVFHKQHCILNVSVAAVKSELRNIIEACRRVE